MTEIKTREDIKFVIEKIKEEIKRLETNPVGVAFQSIATLQQQINWFEEILALEGDLQNHANMIDDKYMEADMDESEVYGWVMGQIDTFDDYFE